MTKSRDTMTWERAASSFTTTGDSHVVAASPTI